MNEPGKLTLWKRGVKDGVPICLGYFAVSFAFGIQAATTGLTVFQAVLMSLTNVTSAGQFAALTLIAASSPFWEMALTQLVLNLRYFLMSCALSQKLKPGTGLGHRLGISFGVTDEIFALSVACDELSPFYSYGLMTSAIPGWCAGTLFGVASGNILPASVVSALGVALYGMFIAIVVPVAKTDRVVLGVAVGAMALSSLFYFLPVLSAVSPGLQIIIVTVVVAGVAAALFPRPDEEEENG